MFEWKTEFLVIVNIVRGIELYVCDFSTEQTDLWFFLMIFFLSVSAGYQI